MKKIFFIALIMVVVVSGLILSGCAKPAPAPAPVPSEVIELKFAIHIPPFASVVRNWEAWGKRVGELTGGKVNIVMYAGGSLVGFPDQYPALLGGVCDITMVMAWDIPEQALETVYCLPMLDWKAEDILDIRKEVEKEFPQIAEGRSAVKTLWLQHHPFHVMHFTKAEARVPDDVKGMKMSGVDSLCGYMEACGATPIILAPPDYYMSLETGVVEGIFMSYEVLGVHKLHEVTKFHLNVPAATAVGSAIMNLDKWNSLPADLQQILEGSFAEVEQTIINTTLAGDRDVHARIAATEGHTVIEPTEAELALWKERAMPLHQEWIDKMEAKGLPGQAVYDKVIEVIGRYK